jgi:hypothetical protein
MPNSMKEALAFTLMVKSNVVSSSIPANVSYVMNMARCGHTRAKRIINNCIRWKFAARKNDRLVFRRLQRADEYVVQHRVYDINFYSLDETVRMIDSFTVELNAGTQYYKASIQSAKLKARTPNDRDTDQGIAEHGVPHTTGFLTYGTIAESLNSSVGYAQRIVNDLYREGRIDIDAARPRKIGPAPDKPGKLDRFQFVYKGSVLEQKPNVYIPLKPRTWLRALPGRKCRYGSGKTQMSSAGRCEKTCPGAAGTCEGEPSRITSAHPAGSGCTAVLDSRVTPAGHTPDCHQGCDPATPAVTSFFDRISGQPGLTREQTETAFLSADPTGLSDAVHSLHAGYQFQAVGAGVQPSSSRRHRD